MVAMRYERSDMGESIDAVGSRVIGCPAACPSIRDQGPEVCGVPYRYVNRIFAHLMNVMTAVVMPLDRLDYWDENKMDRD
jgi:hypothetical protein